MSEGTGWFICTLVSCSLVSLIATIIGYLNIRGDADIMIDITKNWETKAIVDIQVSPNGCPYNYETAYNYEWPGTYSGCWCGDISNYWRNYYEVWKDIYSDYCTWNQSRAGCSEIRSTSSMPINILSSVNNTRMSLCVQRSSETWMNVASYSGNTCPPGKIKCGLSVENTFCVNNGTKCPINDIQMTQLDLPRDYNVLSQCNETNNCLIFSQDWSSAQIIKYKRGDTFDALPTAQFRLNEYGMCKDSGQDDVTPGRSLFLLLRRSRSSCGREGDSFWNKTLYQVSESKLFDLNGISSTIQYLKRFGYYTWSRSGDDYKYYLYSRSYVPWKVSCRDQMSILSQQRDTLDKLRGFEFALMITGIISGIALGIIFPVYIAISSENQFGAASAITNAKWAHFLIRGGLLPIQGFAIKLSQSQLGIYGSIVQRGCASSQVASILSALEKGIWSTHYSNIVCVVFFAFTSLITICFHLSNRTKQTGKYQLSDSLASPETQTSQDNYYSQPKNDYEFQYQQKTAPYYQEQQPTSQNLIYAPPAPQEAQFNHAKPLYQAYDTKYYN